MITDTAFAVAMTKIAGEVNTIGHYLKPMLTGAVLGGASNAAIAPEGHRMEWARTGAIGGAALAGPGQTIFKSVTKGLPIREVAHQQFAKQTLPEQIKWTGVGAGLAASTTHLRGGYKNPDQKGNSLIGAGADTAIDIGTMIMRA